MMKKILLVIACASLLRDFTSANSDGCRPPAECVTTTECFRRHGNAQSVLYPCDRGVCCPSPTPTPTSPTPTRIGDIMQHNNMKLLPQDCGLASSDRIIQGKNASLGQFPWMALIGVKARRQTTVQYICGGSVISSLYVLTAAHCVRDPDKTVVIVRLGEHDQNTNPDCEQNSIDEPPVCTSVVDIAVKQVTAHERYNSTTLKNDIALIRLSKPIVFNTVYISPICLPFGVTDTGAEEKNYIVSGWGKLNGLRTERGSPLLQWATVSGLSTDDCNALAGSAVKLDQSQLCADDAFGSDACQGDSGGPLMVVHKLPSRESPQAFVLGVVSFGFRNCATQNAPSAYTRVNHYLHWILDHMSK